MFDIGFLELILIAIISLIVLGPERLPRAAATAGKWVGKARRMVSQLSREIDRQIETEELREELKKQGDSLDVDEDVKNIQRTVKEALNEAKVHPEFEPLPRTEPEPPTSKTEPRIDPNPLTAQPDSPQINSETELPNTKTDKS